MVVVLMGVTGSGKTTVGKQLAAELGWPFADADDFHPAANKAKMRAGIPLTDDDRWPWLEALRGVIEQALAEGRGAVVACSALKAAYRDVLAGGLADVRFVLLDGDPEVLRARLARRLHEFMNPALLESQIETLERPSDAITIDIELPVDEQVRRIRAALGAELTR
jgi:gluconokinase